MIIRAQLWKPEQALISAELYNQLFTMHGTTMVFMVAMPMAVAFFNYVVPLQIGARDVAFPRLNALSYWIYLFGSLFMNLIWFVNAAPHAGWTGYANLTSIQFSPGQNTNCLVVGLSILGIRGLLMWIPGMLIFWIAITAVWFRWTREEYVEWRREARAAAAHS